jgi:hypothetical protein
MRPATSLTIVYDASSRLCTRLKVWIGREPSVICLRFVATGSFEARTKFPNLPSSELAVVADTEEVVAQESCLDCLYVGVARLPRPCRQVDQPAPHACGPRGIHGCIQESSPTFKYAKPEQWPGDPTTPQAGRRSEMPNRGEVRPA